MGLGILGMGPRILGNVLIGCMKIVKNRFKKNVGTTERRNKVLKMEREDERSEGEKDTNEEDTNEQLDGMHDGIVDMEAEEKMNENAMVVVSKEQLDRMHCIDVEAEYEGILDMEVEENVNENTMVAVSKKQLNRMHGIDVEPEYEGILDMEAEENMNENEMVVVSKKTIK